MTSIMSLPRPFEPKLRPAFTEHPDTLKMILEWIADRFADTGETDTAIDWEDGEEHDEPTPTASA